MLAKLAPELPDRDHVFEPKLDGFRCLAFRDGDAVELQSRHGNLLTRYFPEVAAAVRAVAAARFVLDGELVPESEDFVALMQRLHPAASRVELLAAETPARFVAFDLLAEGEVPLLDVPLRERRERLERLLAGGALGVGDATTSREVAARWLDTREGVVAKHEDAPYAPGKRGWIKVKRRRTADCVVAGFRWRGGRPLPSSLLLGV